MMLLLSDGAGRFRSRSRCMPERGTRTAPPEWSASSPPRARRWPPPGRWWRASTTSPGPRATTWPCSSPSWWATACATPASARTTSSACGSPACAAPCGWRSPTAARASRRSGSAPGGSRPAARPLSRRPGRRSLGRRAQGETCVWFELWIGDSRTRHRLRAPDHVVAPADLGILSPSQLKEYLGALTRDERAVSAERGAMHLRIREARDELDRRGMPA